MRVVVTRFFILFLIFSICVYSNLQANERVFVIGQDIKSINDYMNQAASIKPAANGFMVYAAINDTRGLWEPVDQGAGWNHADEIIKKYPHFSVVQVGLDLRFMLKEILNHSFDQRLDEMARWFKTLPHQVYLRIGYEADFKDNEYQPKDYILAYRYIVDRLRTHGLKNVFYVWHVLAWQENNQEPYRPWLWYPGDNYVNWVAISFFDRLHRAERNAVAQFARQKHKPLMIAESSPIFCLTDQDKARWIKELFEFCRLQNVQFLSYIAVNWDELKMFKDKGWGNARLYEYHQSWQLWKERLTDFTQSKASK